MLTPFEWDYEEKRRYKGDTLSEKQWAYLLLYYNPDKVAQEESWFNQHMTDLHQELVDGTKHSYWEKEYA